MERIEREVEERSEDVVGECVRSDWEGDNPSMPYWYIFVCEALVCDRMEYLLQLVLNKKKGVIRGSPVAQWSSFE